jgi:hypothetical protein
MFQDKFTRDLKKYRRPKTPLERGQGRKEFVIGWILGIPGVAAIILLMNYVL